MSPPESPGPKENNKYTTGVGESPTRGPTRLRQVASRSVLMSNRNPCSLFCFQLVAEVASRSGADARTLWAGSSLFMGLILIPCWWSQGRGAVKASRKCPLMPAWKQLDCCAL